MTQTRPAEEPPTPRVDCEGARAVMGAPEVSRAALAGALAELVPQAARVAARVGPAAEEA